MKRFNLDLMFGAMTIDDDDSVEKIVEETE